MPAKPTFYKSVLFTAGGLLLSVLVAVLIGEVVMRYVVGNQTLSRKYISPFKVYRSNKYYLHQPNYTDTYTVSEFSYPHITNRAGMTGLPLPKKRNNKVRIAILGDSFTEGIGAPPDSSYPHLLQKLFNTYLPNKVEILNAGLCGSDPVYEYELLKDSIEEYHPDIVIVNILSGDIRDMRVRGGFERFKEDGTVEYKRAPRTEGVFAKSVLFRYVLTKVLQYDMLLTPPSQIPAQTNLAIRQINIAVDSIADYTKQKGTNLLVVYNLTANELVARHLDLQSSLDHAKRRNLKTVDLLFWFLRNGVDNKNVYEYFWPQDFHNTSKGYELYAKGVYASLLESYPEIFSKLDSAKAK